MSETKNWPGGWASPDGSCTFTKAATRLTFVAESDALSGHHMAACHSRGIRDALNDEADLAALTVARLVVERDEAREAGSALYEAIGDVLKARKDAQENLSYLRSGLVHALGMDGDEDDSFIIGRAARVVREKEELGDSLAQMRDRSAECESLRVQVNDLTRLYTEAKCEPESVPEQLREARAANADLQAELRALKEKIGCLVGVDRVPPPKASAEDIERWSNSLAETARQLRASVAPKPTKKRLEDGPEYRWAVRTRDREHWLCDREGGFVFHEVGPDARATFATRAEASEALASRNVWARRRFGTHYAEKGIFVRIRVKGEK